MILLDNIIFSLQFSGGISIVWYEHLKRLLLDVYFEQLHLIEYDDANKNIFRKRLNIPEEILLKTSGMFINMKRFLDVRYNNLSPFVFHSSYYRTCRNVNAINITTVHDFTYEYFFTGLKKRIHCWQKHKAIRLSDYIICISENTKKDLLKFLPDIDKNKIRVVYNGVSDDYKVIDNHDSVDFLFPFKSRDFILYVGERARYKNFQLAVNAIAESSLNFIIVGGPLTKEESIFLERKLGKKRYKYIGRISNYDLNILYNNAFCLLYPSAYEGFGIPVLEAQKAGCPVIAYNSSSIPEIIGDTKLLLNSLTIEEIVKCFEILDDNYERENIIQNGLDNVTRFTWDKTYEHTCAIYKEALDFKV